MDYRFGITCWVTLRTGERCRVTSGDVIAGDELETGNLASCLQQHYCTEVPPPVPAPTPAPAPAPAPTTQTAPKATLSPVGAKKNQAAPQQ